MTYKIKDPATVSGKYLITARISDDLFAFLTQLCTSTNKDMSFHIRKALLYYAVTLKRDRRLE